MSLTFSTLLCLDTITWSNSEGFIKLDSNENGFYRVNYDTSNWKSIIAFLSNDPMSQVWNVIICEISKLKLTGAQLKGCSV